VLDSPLVWTADTGVLALVWLTFVGAGAVYRQNGHVAVTGIVAKLPRLSRLAVAFVTSLAIGFAVVVMGRVAITAALVQAGQEIITLEISRSWYSIPIVWAAISTGLATLTALLDQIFPASDLLSEV
jgi:TRAP-type C4-dicarboxylate transport system permease small subunit